MKLTHTAYGETTVIEIDHDDVQIDEMAQYLRQLLVGSGYAEQNVREILPEDE